MLTRFKAICSKLVKVVALNAVLLSVATIATAQESSSRVGESAFPAAAHDMSVEAAVTQSMIQQSAQRQSQDAAHQRVRDLLQPYNPAIPQGLQHNIGIRCIPNDAYSRSLDSTAQSTADNRAITINLGGNCGEVWIRVLTTDAMVYSLRHSRNDRALPIDPVADFDRADRGDDNSWLTRTGSGWYWLTH